MPENFEWLKASIVVLLSTIAEFCFQINVSPEVDDNVAQHPSILTTSIFFPIKKSTFNETQFLSITHISIQKFTGSREDRKPL